MLFKDITHDNSTRYLIIDKLNDLAQIPQQQYGVGTICYVCAEQSKYILNNAREWVLMPITGSGGSIEGAILSGGGSI